MTYRDIYEAVYDNYDNHHVLRRQIKSGEPESLNLAEETLERHIESRDPALRIRDFETGDDETYTFQELNAAANQAANFLKETMAQGERLGLMLPPRLELYAILFGGIKSQRIILPLDTKFGPDALSYRLDNAEATTLFTTSDHLNKVNSDRVPSLERVVVVDGSGEKRPNGIDVIPYDRVKSKSSDFEAIRLHPAEPFGEVYSSGTTGQPSQHPLPHGAVLAAESYRKFVMDLQRDDTYFAAVSPAWSYGFVAGTLSPVLVGTNIGAYRGRFDAEMWVDTLEKWNVTNAMVAPTALRQLRASDFDPSRYNVNLRILITAGETLDAEWTKKHLGTIPLDAYGLSEGGMLLCNYPFPDWEIKHGSMGKPTPGYDVRLCDPDESPVATDEDPAPEEKMEFIDEPGVVGEICAYQSGGQGPLEGLQPEGWQRMGDLAEVDEDGYWWYRGRADEVIISAGYRIGPDEVQETLVDHDAVQEAGVIGVDHETRGNVVKAYVTLAPGYEESDELREKIIQYAKTKLSKHEYPRKLEFVDELPMTASDKLIRRKLKERHEQTREKDET